MSQTVSSRTKINHLKDRYRRGVRFTDAYAICDELSRTFGEPCFTRQASDWDRQARFELYPEGVFVTQPVYGTGYERFASASAERRKLSQSERLRETLTRLERQLVVALCAARQPDATPSEIGVYARLEMIVHNMREVIAIMTSSPGANGLARI